MAKESTSYEDYSLLWVVKILLLWRRPIIALIALVAIGSAAYTWFVMPNYYKSTAIVYAASPTLANPNPIGGGEKVYYVYGTGEDLDRLMTISNSTEIKAYLISKYDLATHYDIDTTSSKGKAKLMQKFEKHYEILKTKEDAMKISIEDVDPAKARDMVRDAREKISELAQALVKSSQSMTINTLENAINEQATNLRQLSDTLSKVKKLFNIYNASAQSENLAMINAETRSDLAGMEAMLSEMRKYNLPSDSINKVKAKVAGLRSKAKVVSDDISTFNNGVLLVEQLESSQEKALEELSLTEQRLQKLHNTYKQSFTAMHIIEKESVPNEKSRPRRSIIVLGLTMLAFVLASLYALVIESFRTVDWKQIYAKPS